MSGYGFESGLAVAPDGSHHVLLRYDFPEHYYTSGSTQDELFYLTDKNGPWDLPSPELVFGIPPMNYAQAMIIPSSIQVGPTGAPEALYVSGLAASFWTLNHATRTAPGTWTADWSDRNEMARPNLLGVARNAGGVLYLFWECGYYGDVLCVDRRAGGASALSNLTGAYGLALSAGVDSAGHAHVLWTEGLGTNGITSSQLVYSTDASGSWVPTVLPGSTSMATSDVFAPHLAIAPDDTVHIVFKDLSGRIQHGVLGANGFVLDPVGASGQLALAVDGGGTPWVLAALSSSVALYRPGAGGAWASEALPMAGGPAYLDSPWLGFDAAGKPHAFFSDSSGQSSQLRLGWKP
jgi:hypothetical protein